MIVKSILDFIVGIIDFLIIFSPSLSFLPLFSLSCCCPNETNNSDHRMALSKAHSRARRMECSAQWGVLPCFISLCCIALRKKRKKKKKRKKRKKKIASVSVLYFSGGGGFWTLLCQEVLYPVKQNLHDWNLICVVRVFHQLFFSWFLFVCAKNVS